MLESGKPGNVPPRGLSLEESENSNLGSVSNRETLAF